MNYGNILNSIGLLIDIAGAILLYNFGLPETIRRDGAILMAIEDTDENEKKKAKKYDFWGRVGLVCLIIGFGFQFWSNFL